MSVSGVSGNTTSSVSSVSSVGYGHSDSSQSINFSDNIFSANFNSSKGVEETSGSLAKAEPNLFEESAGQLANNSIQGFGFEESAGQLAQGGLNLVA